MRIAAIGIGSNSLRMLLADISEGKMHRLHRFREGLRVFAALDEQKRISSEMMRKACESVAGFRKEAEAAGAEAVHLFATSAVRDAANQQEFAQALLEHTGLALDVCSGEKEARLSFLGAMEKGPTGVIDIGGGSTELVVGDEKGVSTAASVQMSGTAFSPASLIQRAGGADSGGMRQRAFAPCAAPVCQKPTGAVDWRRRHLYHHGCVGPADSMEPKGIDPRLPVKQAMRMAFH